MRGRGRELDREGEERERVGEGEVGSWTDKEKRGRESRRKR